MKAQSGHRQKIMRAVAYNADGTIKRDYGIISYQHRNPVINWVVNHYISLKRAINDRKERSIQHGNSSH